jgi:hypothetical protein
MEVGGEDSSCLLLAHNCDISIVEHSGFTTTDSV